MTEDELKSKSYEDVKDIFFRSWDEDDLILSLINDMIHDRADTSKLGAYRNVVEIIKAAVKELKSELSKKSREELIKITVSSNKYSKAFMENVILASEE